MKQKVFDYIEDLERKAKESEKYFKLWHEEKIKNNKAIEQLEYNKDKDLVDDVIREDVFEEIINTLKGADKE